MPLRNPIWRFEKRGSRWEFYEYRAVRGLSLVIAGVSSFGLGVLAGFLVHYLT